MIARAVVLGSDQQIGSKIGVSKVPVCRAGPAYEAGSVKLHAFICLLCDRVVFLYVFVSIAVRQLRCLLRTCLVSH